MSANNKYTDNEFNKLMQDAFLDLDTGNPENSQLLDEVAKTVYATEWPGVSDKHSASTITKNNKVAMWAWFLSDVVIIISVGIFGWNVLGKTELKAEKNSNSEFVVGSLEKKDNSSVLSENKNSVLSLQNEKTNVLRTENTKDNWTNTLNKAFNVPLTTKEKEVLSDPNLTNASEPQIKLVIFVNGDTTVVDMDKVPSATNEEENMNESAIPEFTEEETKEHLKEKEKFILSFSGMKKTEFALVNIPGETSGHRFLKTNEVSNFEYNMFLNDLIIKGKTKEYEIAKHKNEKLFAGKDELINKVFLNRYLKKNKFEREHKYKYYPVVCVSIEGMEMYCAWLKEQIQEYYKQNDQKVTVTVRLPKTSEWKAAALCGEPDRKYATYNGKLTDEDAKSKWLANFVQTQNSYVSGDQNILLNRSDKNGKVKPLTLGKNMFTISSVTEGKINKNDSYGLQNMSGNVSEVVIDSDDEKSKKFRTIGGNWNSKKKFLLIESPDEFKGKTEPSIYVGFRPIVILEP